MDESIYKLDWAESSEPLAQDHANINASFVIISAENEASHAVAVSALHLLGVNDPDITSFFVAEPNSEFPMQEQLLPLIEKVHKPEKKLFVVNMLPTLTDDIPLEACWASKAEWLCFESSVEILKVLNTLNIRNSAVIAISRNVEGDFSVIHGIANPWGSIARGTAVTASLDVPQLIVSATMDRNADKNDFIKLFLRINKDSVESRLSIKKGIVYEPIISRQSLEVGILHIGLIKLCLDY